MPRIIYLSLLLVIIGCSGTKPPLDSKDFPDWYLNPPTFDGKYVGVVDAARPQISLAKSVATMRAKAEISNAIKSSVTNEVKQYMDASGIGTEARAVSYSQEVQTLLSSNVIKAVLLKKLR